ncbi:hypothetical protein ON010_g5605 [Phytophthora cinnamomi]|nr:hypothetical protein ON010_g5605 [Phytophthora cinnamomi]
MRSVFGAALFVGPATVSAARPRYCHFDPALAVPRVLVAAWLESEQHSVATRSTPSQKSSTVQQLSECADRWTRAAS